MSGERDELVEAARTAAVVLPARDESHSRLVLRPTSRGERRRAGGRTHRRGRDDRPAGGAAPHDVERAKEDRGEIDDHAEWGAEESARILDEHGASRETADAVAHCVRAHRYSSRTEPETIEAELLSDADNLDALGAVGIARCFSYGGERGSPFHDPSLPPEEDPTATGETQFNHVHKKLLELPGRMYTDAGRKRADERVAFVRTFVRRFETEAAGDVH